MAIQPVSSVPAVSKISVDSNTRTIQTQINSKQQHMKKISSDDTITATEKEEKRRQLQKEIDELNRKLELKKQEQEEKAKEATRKQEQEAMQKAEFLKEDTLKKISTSDHEQKKLDSEQKPKENDVKPEKKEPEHVDMPVKEIQKMLSAEYLVQKEQMQKQVDTKADNTIQVVKSEIAQDQRYGSDTTKKESELETLQQKQNFWSDAQKQEKATINQNPKVIIDQI